MSINVKLIRDSFGAIKPHADEVMNYFYSTLFRKYPQSKGLFTKVDMKKQRMALAGSLATVVDNLEDAGFIVSYLQKLGSRHGEYGTQPEHFGWVADALLETLAYYFDAQWTEELKSEWTKVYMVAAEHMQIGLAQAQAQPHGGLKITPEPTIMELAKQYARNILQQAINEEADAEFMHSAREKARATLKMALKEEADELLEAVTKKAA